MLNRAANAAKQAGVPCNTIQVEDAQPYQAIIAAAGDRGCDLIVMASHGRSGLSALVLGSVTNKVLTYTKKLRCWCVTECAGDPRGTFRHSSRGLESIATPVCDKLWRPHDPSAPQILSFRGPDRTGPICLLTVL